jgi:hypothetical protein
MARFSTTGGSGNGSALNYVQVAGAQQTISSAPNSIIDLDITTTGAPVQISVTGEGANASADSWVKMNLFRDGTAIGNEIQIEASAASENVPFAINFIDDVAAGTYNYSARVTSKSSGNWQFGEVSGPVMNAVELTGFKGDTGETGPAGEDGSGAIADFIFTDNGGSSTITLPGAKRMDIISGDEEDLYITSGDDLYLTALLDDVIIRANDDISFTSNYDNNGTEFRWSMDSSGTFNLPGSGYISNPVGSSGDGNSYDTIQIVPDDNRYGADQYLIIDPTEPNHIHIRAGGTQDASNAELILGGEKAQVKVVDFTHKVYVQSWDDGNDIYHNWEFGSDGKIYGPGEDGALTLGGELLTDVTNMSIRSTGQAVVLNGELGEFLGSSDDAASQIATVGDLITNTDGSWTTNFTDASGTLAGITATGNYNRIGNMVFFCVNVSFDGYSNLGTGQYQFDLPFAPRQTFTARGGTLHNPNTDSKYHIAAIVDLVSDGANAKAKLYYTGSTADLAWKYNTPVNWAHNTAHFDMSGFYEIAQ